jgi:hypothetical protein
LTCFHFSTTNPSQKRSQSDHRCLDLPSRWLRHVKDTRFDVKPTSGHGVDIPGHTAECRECQHEHLRIWYLYNP